MKDYVKKYPCQDLEGEHFIDCIPLTERFGVPCGVVPSTCDACQGEVGGTRYSTLFLQFGTGLSLFNGEEEVRRKVTQALKENLDIEDKKETLRKIYLETVENNLFLVGKEDRVEFVVTELEL